MALERLELRVERLRTTYRFTWAFHAREVRFEFDAGQGFHRAFPETFSFRPERHDPAELYLQLEDLWANPRLLAEAATRREAEEVVRRLLQAAPRYVERILQRMEADPAVGPAALAILHADATLLVRTLLRFLEDKHLEATPALRMAGFHLRKLHLHALLGLSRAHVPPQAIAAYLAGGERAESDPSDDPSGAAFFGLLAKGDPEARAAAILGRAERAFHAWLEEVCLDESNQAFESEDSPFDDRETEVLRAAALNGRWIARGRDLSPFLRRRRSRSCRRVLQGLEHWFLRQYDVHHAAAVIRHESELRRERDDGAKRLSYHEPRSYLLALGLLALPFVGGVFGYARAPRLFDALCSLEVLAVNAMVFWFLLYRFCWQRDLTFFHASVPRIGAGIIVGYLPVFLIDEIWDLSRTPWWTLGVVVMLLAFPTLLYLYVEVQRRIEDPAEAFRRARAIFLLGLVESLALGLIVTSLFGHFMVARNWFQALGVHDFESLRAAMPPVLGELPRIVGLEPVVTFPSAVFVMTFLSFFIGTFLQLLWEDLPITEPL